MLAGKKMPPPPPLLSYFPLAKGAPERRLPASGQESARRRLMQGRSRRSRFSLLLLDHGELYLEDHGCYFHPASTQQATLLGLRTTKKLKGRLRVASCSLTFEPEELTVPIMRILLKELYGGASMHTEGGAEAFEITTTTGVMTKRDLLQPFSTCRLAASGAVASGAAASPTAGTAADSNNKLRL